MKTERQPEQPVPSDDEANPEETLGQPTFRRPTYKGLLSAVVIGILAISVLGTFVIRLGGNPSPEVPTAESDPQAHEAPEVKGPPVMRSEDEYGAIDRRLATLSGGIDRGFEAQQTHRSLVKHQLTAMAESLQAIKAGIADRENSHKELSRRISEASSRLESLVTEVRALKVDRRKPTLKRPAVKTPPFQLDAIDVWDDVTYAAVSQAGRAAFLKAGEQRSGWTVTHIDRLKGQVDLQGPAGQAHSISVPR